MLKPSTLLKAWLQKHTTIKKFLKSEFGLAVVFLVVLALSTLSVTAGIGYFHKTSQPIPTTQTNTTTAPNGFKPFDANTTKTPQATGTTNDGANSQTPKNTPNTNSSIGNVKPYVASICTNTTIPYTTRYVNDSSLEKGQTLSSGGVNGIVRTCTPDSSGMRLSAAEFMTPAVEEVIRVGTKPRQNHNMCVAGYLAQYPANQQQSSILFSAANQWCWAHGDIY